VDDGEAVEEVPQVEDLGESATTHRETLVAGEKECASGHIRSMRADAESDQRTSSGVDNVPETPPEPPLPPSSPTAPSAQAWNVPLSVELEGEKRLSASCDVTPTRAETNVSEASKDIEDAGNGPKKPMDGSEHERKPSKQSEEGYSPSRPPVESDEPVGETAVPGDRRNKRAVLC